MSTNVNDLQAQVAALQAQLKAARAAEGQAIRLKVSEKGAVSIYGLGRFPVTLYRSQMERLINAAPTITQFMADNSAKLVSKAAPAQASA